MFRLSGGLRSLFANGAVLLAMHIGVVVAGTPISGDPLQLLKQADAVKTTNHAEFTRLLKQLGDNGVMLSAEQSAELRYLEAWESGYSGDYARALHEYDAVASGTANLTLQFRANAAAINTLANGSRYQEAFERLAQLLERLPQISDKDARAQGLATAAFLYDEAGQYDLASTYADELLKEEPGNNGYACRAWYMKVAALYKSGKVQGFDQKLHDGVETCVKANDVLWANGIRFFEAGFDIQNGRSQDAIKLLRANYADVEKTSYPWLISQFDATLAQAYWDVGDATMATHFSLAAVNGNIKAEVIESLATAYRLLYLIERRQGNLESALSYHEKYMAADKGYLDTVSAKALAYQIVSQQVLAKKLQIDTLNKQNQILQLQQSLDKSASEASRLYIILLLTVLAFIAFWAYRVKRSQLSFMKLARRDGLTGIFNRQHFVSSAELQLQYCKKSARQACLVLIDLDHFKLVNDTHGHAVGDRVLKRAVAACQEHLRSTDIFGRLGGEEFGIVLPECTLDQALGRAEQIRLAIATAASSEDALGVPISASFGVASIVRSGYELRQLLIDADDGLYRAKREGRNRVRVCDDTQPRRRVAGVATDRA